MERRYLPCGGWTISWAMPVIFLSCGYARSHPVQGLWVAGMFFVQNRKMHNLELELLEKLYESLIVMDGVEDSNCIGEDHDAVAIIAVLSRTLL